MFTQEELEMIKFVVASDLEVVNTALENEGESEGWQYDKRILQGILAKLGDLPDDINRS